MQAKGRLWRNLEARWPWLAILLLGAAALTTPVAPRAPGPPFVEMAPRLSHDGRYLVCEQPQGPSSPLTDVWWSDLQTHRSVRLHPPGNANSFSPQVSADGKTALFASWATNLASSGKGGLFYWELDHPGPRQITVHPEWPAALAPDGSMVAYASNPVTVFMGHPQPGPVTLELWKPTAGGSPGSGGGLPGSPGGVPPEGGNIPGLGILPRRADAWVEGAPAFSPDSRRLAVPLYEVGPGARCEVWHGELELSASVSDLSQRGQLAPALKEPCYNLCLSGPVAAFASRASNLVQGDRNLACDIFLCELPGGRLERVLGPDGLEPDDDSLEPSLSADGRWVAFTSRADNLTEGDDNKLSDVFLYDRESRHLRCLSRSPQVGNGPSYRPCVSGDGGVVVFVSRATNLDSRHPPAGQIYRWSRGTEKLEWIPLNP